MRTSSEITDRFTRRAGDDGAAADHRVSGRAVLDELRRRQRRREAEDRPLPVVQVEDRLQRDQVHVRVVVGVQRADVPPVAAVAVGRAWHLVAGEVVHVRGTAVHEIRNDVAAHVVHRGLVGGVDLERLDQRVGGEHVIAHRRVRDVRVVRHRRRVGRLLEESGDVDAVVGRLDHAERRRVLARHPDTRPRSPRRRCRCGPSPSATGPSGTRGRRRKRPGSPDSRRTPGSATAGWRRRCPCTSAVRAVAGPAPA